MVWLLRLLRLRFSFLRMASRFKRWFSRSSGHNLIRGMRGPLAFFSFLLLLCLVLCASLLQSDRAAAQTDTFTPSPSPSGSPTPIFWGECPSQDVILTVTPADLDSQYLAACSHCYDLDPVVTGTPGYFDIPDLTIPELQAWTAIPPDGTDYPTATPYTPDGSPMPTADPSPEIIYIDFVGSKGEQYSADGVGFHTCADDGCPLSSSHPLYRVESSGECQVSHHIEGDWFGTSDSWGLGAGGGYGSQAAYDGCPNGEVFVSWIHLASISYISEISYTVLRAPYSQIAFYDDDFSLLYDQEFGLSYGNSSQNFTAYPDVSGVAYIRVSSWRERYSSGIDDISWVYVSESPTPAPSPTDSPLGGGGYFADSCDPPVFDDDYDDLWFDLALADQSQRSCYQVLPPIHLDLSSITGTAAGDTAPTGVFDFPGVIVCFDLYTPPMLTVLGLSIDLTAVFLFMIVVWFVRLFLRW